jgi:alanyl-tRNA synthetase
VFGDLADAVFEIYKDDYLKSADIGRVVKILEDESNKFYVALKNGEKLVDKVSAFDLYQTHGLPLEVIEELYKERKLKFIRSEIEEEIEKHKERSRTTSAGVFKGGLADHSEEVVRLHTATHLLLASLRKVLGEQVVQKGQNITKERSRFDFPNQEKLNDDQLKEVEEMINKVISDDLPVNFKVMPKDEAVKTGAIHAFNEKYADTVKVYFVGEDIDSAFSKEFCGGPHVTSTGTIGRVRIKKQEKIGSGLIRIYLIIDRTS